MGEFDYIRWLRTQVRSTDRIELGIGDDCAVVAVPEERVLITTDMLMEGIHFRLAEAGPRRVGRKALAVNLSDIAAMAGRPVAAVVSLALPRDGAGKLAEELLLGMQPLADDFATAIVGGDTNAWPGPLVISITVIGEPGPSGPVLRSGAKPGDWLLVTGPLGGSRGTKEYDFTPRIQEARALALLCNVHAMIDLSDGLAGDLGHVCTESGVGAVLFAERIPIAAAATGDRLRRALTDGEDFELAFAVSPADGRLLIDKQPVPGVTLVHVGEFRAERGIVIEEGGTRRPLEAKGYVHEFE
ncbi:MAG TPA: thiamine-phosphate kinase [Gemmataceae bacterium]|jgi:thiamine-monophosphate kinase|nr:thiamine-phosphate kinase [Gemmataceae bacterium]